ncbi:MAG: hypothetical protein V4613_02930 [Bacteroidota bacterium]
MNSTKLLICLALVLIVSCTKKTETTIIQSPPDPTLFGSWRFVDTVEYYIYFDKDSRYSYNLNQTEFGIKTLYTSIFIANDKQLNYNNTNFNYSINGDTLKLVHITGVNQIETTLLVKSDMVPDKWVKPLASTNIDIIRPELFGRVFGVDGTTWYVGYDTTVYRYNSLSKTFEDSTGTLGNGIFSVCLAAPGRLGLGFDYGSDENPKEINKVGFGNRTDAASEPLKQAVMSFDPANSYYYMADYAYNDVYRLKSGDPLTKIFSLPGNVHFPVFYKNNSMLAVTEDGTIIKFNISPLKVTDTYRLNNKDYISHISTDGTSVYVTVADYKDYRLKIQKITL